MDASHSKPMLPGGSLQVLGLQICLIWFVPESPRWLIARDRREEAYDILAKVNL